MATPYLSKKLSSNSSERIVRRLKQDAPKIAEALAKGEFKSARAAGIAGGKIRHLAEVSGTEVKFSCKSSR